MKEKTEHLGTMHGESRQHMFAEHINRIIEKRVTKRIKELVPRFPEVTIAKKPMYDSESRNQCPSNAIRPKDKASLRNIRPRPIAPSTSHQQSVKSIRSPEISGDGNNLAVSKLKVMHSFSMNPTAMAVAGIVGSATKNSVAVSAPSSMYSIKIPPPQSTSTAARQPVVSSVTSVSTSTSSSLTDTSSLVSSTSTAASEKISNSSMPSFNVIKPSLPILEDHSVNTFAFLCWLTSFSRSQYARRKCSWPRTRPELDALQSMNQSVCIYGMLGVYSESPFYQPVMLLRRVQLLCPNHLDQCPSDKKTMLQKLLKRTEEKVSQVAKTVGGCSGLGAPELCFQPNFLRHTIILELDRPLISLLTMQAQGFIDSPKWRVIMRLGWITSGLYMPSSNEVDPVKRPRVLVPESLPRCLSVTLKGHLVKLPEPIFHGGHAERLGKRLPISIDITDYLPVNISASKLSRMVQIDIRWLHVPMEDHPAGLLELVLDGLISPFFCELVSFPVVQITLDRVRTGPELCSIFQPDLSDEPVSMLMALDDTLLSTQSPLGELIHCPNGSSVLFGVIGCFDKCLPSSTRLFANETMSSLRERLEHSNDCTSTAGEDVQAADYIPVSLSCPLTRTRITVPVRSVECKHFQCFDLVSYLKINQRRPRWTCPICSCATPFRNLRFDELFNTILTEATLDYASFVHVYPDGRWRYVSKENGDNDFLWTKPNIKNSAEFNSTRPCVHFELEDSPIQLDSDEEVEGGDLVEPECDANTKQVVDHNSCEGTELVVISDESDDEDSHRDYSNNPLEQASETPVIIAEPPVLDGLNGDARSFSQSNTTPIRIDLTEDDPTSDCKTVPSPYEEDARCLSPFAPLTESDMTNMEEAAILTTTSSSLVSPEAIISADSDVSNISLACPMVAKSCFEARRKNPFPCHLKTLGHLTKDFLDINPMDGTSIASQESDSLPL